MTWLVALALVVCLLVTLWAISDDSAPEIDPEEVTRTAIELHAIQRRIDVAQTRSELQRDAMQIRRELAEELRRVDDAP